jgi:hypothetical protein
MYVCIYPFITIQRVLAMVCNTENYWVSGLWPSSGILSNRKHNVSEIGFKTPLILNLYLYYENFAHKVSRLI